MSTARAHGLAKITERGAAPLIRRAFDCDIDTTHHAIIAVMIALARTKNLTLLSGLICNTMKESRQIRIWNTKVAPVLTIAERRALGQTNGESAIARNRAL